MSIHNNQKYMIYAIRESDYTRNMLRGLQTYAPHFKKSTDGVNLRIRLISMYNPEDKKFLRTVETEYGYEVNPAFLVKPDKTVLEANEIYEFVRFTAIGGRQVGSNMNRESPISKIMSKPVNQTTEIDALAPHDDTDDQPSTVRMATGAITESVRSKSKPDAPRNSPARNTGDDMTDGKRVKTANKQSAKDNWKGDNNGRIRPAKSDVKLMSKFSEEINGNVNDEEITNYFKKAGGVKKDKKKY